MAAKPISDLCVEAGTKPSQFYLWQKQFFENGAAFANSDLAVQRIELAKDGQLDAHDTRIQNKNDVLTELMEEHVQLNKALGEP